MNSEEHEQQSLKVTNMLLKKYGGAYEDNQLFKQNYGWPLGAKLNLSQDRSFD